MFKKFTILVISILFCTSLNASDIARNGGPYIGMGYGISNYNDDGYYTRVKDWNIASYNLYAGAYINPNLSVELGYLKTGKFHTEENSVQTTFDYSSITVNVLAHYPVLDDSFDFYAKFGAGQSYVSLSSNDGAALVYGAGISYRYNKSFALRIAYDMYTFDYQSDTKGNYSMDIQYAYAALEVQF